MHIRNIWDYARYRVDNKSVAARIGHSARFHGIRSAVNSSGSFASKASGAVLAVGRASLSLIPIPVFGTIVSTIVSGVEAKTRTWLHERHLKCDPNGVPKNPEYVKFALKEVSVADMDRYRFKVEHAISELNAALSSWPSMQDKAEKLGGRCTAKVDVALKIAQAERRLDIFDGKVLELQCLMKACTKWSEELRDSVNTTKSDTTKSFLKLEQDQGWNATGHENCGDYCLYDGGSVSTTWDKFKKDAASVIKQLQDPIDPESLLSLNKTSFTKADQVKANYE